VPVGKSFYEAHHPFSMKNPSDSLAMQLLCLILSATACAAAENLAGIVPEEDPTVVLHNPGMGWVVYENYAVDQDPGGSSTLLTLPDEPFTGVDEVAVMFSWADVEKEENQYDFSKPNYAYDYWRSRGKEIQLRVSTESLLWWANREPPSGQGVPAYVLKQIPEEQKQVRENSGLNYHVVDARNSIYQERLSKFLSALRANFDSVKRPVTLIDLRAFGLWGEWHSGFQYPSPKDRHDGLSTLLDIWSQALPDHFLSLSYSYDPDGPKEYYEGPRDRLDPASISHYRDYLAYSAFDHALTRSNITFRRDGCGGAVRSNERLLCETAFSTRDKGPFMSEFLGGYAQNKKGGDKWVSSMIDDALSLHPNYIALLGWQGGDALNFIRNEAGLFSRGSREMGYRLVPVKVSYPGQFSVAQAFTLKTEWLNRGVGRAQRNFDLFLSLHDQTGAALCSVNAGAISTSQWIKAATYSATNTATFKDLWPGHYSLALRVVDSTRQRTIELPLKNRNRDGSYKVGAVTVSN
jgi:hypothetical protein